jgi:hypothetical protein
VALNKLKTVSFLNATPQASQKSRKKSPFLIGTNPWLFCR